MSQHSRCLAIAACALAQAPLAAVTAADQPSPFDGDWDVTLACPASADGRAMAYSFEFPAQAKNGEMVGERGTPGEPGWLRLTGPIRPDGSAALTAEGMTNIPGYALYAVKRGTHYIHAVTARFDGRHGSGEWITVRTCKFDFTKR
jgi:hypothetical protein